MLPRLTGVEEDDSKARELDTQKPGKACENGPPPTRNEKHARFKELLACGQLSPSVPVRPSGVELGRRRTGGVELGTRCTEEFSLAQGSLWDALEAVEARANACGEVRRYWVRRFCSAWALARRTMAEACSGVGGQRWHAWEQA